IVDNLGIDSLQKISIISTILKQYDLPDSIFDEEDEINTIKDIIDILYKNKDKIDNKQFIPFNMNSNENNKESKIKEQYEIDYLVPVMQNEPIVKRYNLKKFNNNDFIFIICQSNNIDDFCLKLKHELLNINCKSVILKQKNSINDKNLNKDKMFTQFINLDLSKPDNIDSVLSKIFINLVDYNFRGVIYIYPDNYNEDSIENAIFKSNFLTKNFFNLTKSTLPFFKKNKNNELLLFCITKIDGMLGYSNSTIYNPLTSIPTGFIKAFNKEYPYVNCKIIDIEKFDNNALPCIISEIITPQTDIEVGYYNNKRYVIYLEKKILKSQKDKINSSNNCFLVTGGSRGITAEIIKSLSKKNKGHFIILGRTNFPDNIKELSNLTETELKNKKDEIYNDLKNNNEDISPINIKKKHTNLLNQIEAYKNIEEIRKDGSEVDYYSIDVSNQEALFHFLNSLKEKKQTIDTIIHAAGIDKSKFFVNQNINNIMQEISVKINPMLVFDYFIKQLEVKNIISFGSIAGFFGNAAQTGYSTANDLLNKFAALFNIKHKINSICINWTAWQDKGMATRESVLANLKDSGLMYLSLDNGINAFNDIFMNKKNITPVVIVTAGGIKNIINSRTLILGKSKLNSNDHDFIEILYNEKNFRLIDSVNYFCKNYKAVLTILLSPQKDRFLKDHLIDNISYMPAVISMEILAETSCFLFPNYKIVSLQNIQFNNAINFYSNDEKQFFVTAICKNYKPEKNIINLDVKIQSSHTSKKNIFISGTVILAKDKKLNLSLYKKEMRNEDILFTIDKDFIYQKFDDRNVINYGKTFQLIKSLSLYKNNEIYCEIDTPFERDFFMDNKQVESLIKPHLIEVALQSAGWLSLVTKKETILPKKIHKIEFMDMTDLSLKKLYINTCFYNTNNKNSIYNSILFDENKRVIFKLKGEGIAIKKDITISFEDL
ncbi:MAG: SDR family NAD(P)-dependent oxidoreductase, partial [Spirochaetes bacterium]|nr:SDR family NAD(P)-dependent oxidoreductase [Spirochaetota bacterium]